MQDKEFFSMALGLKAPWKVKDVQMQMDMGAQRVTINVECRCGSTWADESGVLTVHGYEERLMSSLRWTQSCLQPVIKVAHTLQAHWEGLLTYFRHKITDTMSECFNSTIQSIEGQRQRLSQLR